MTQSTEAGSERSVEHTDDHPAAPLRLRDWHAAPPILDTLLALCEPPGWDLSPPQRLGRHHSALNVLRLWRLIERVQADRRTVVHQLRIEGPPRSQAWWWDAWRHPARLGQTCELSFALEMEMSTLRFAVRIDEAPRLHRQLRVFERLAAEPVAIPPRWDLVMDPGVVHAAYPQARAFVAALIFSTPAKDIYVGPALAGTRGAKLW